MTAKGWSRPFDEPIPLPDGGELRTLIDAGRYVAALPLGMHQREEWQAVGMHSDLDENQKPAPSSGAASIPSGFPAAPITGITVAP
jgi:hypothetical protein